VVKLTCILKIEYSILDLRRNLELATEHSRDCKKNSNSKSFQRLISFEHDKIAPYTQLGVQTMYLTIRKLDLEYHHSAL